MSKEVTLRQCEECGEEVKEEIMVITAWNSSYENYDEDRTCIHCVIKEVNQEKKAAGDKTEFVLIEKQRDQGLGDTITEAYKQDTMDIGGWDDLDLEGQDTPDIQEKINKLKP